MGRHRRVVPPSVKDRADVNLGFAWLRLIGAATVVIDHSAPLIYPERLTIFPASWEMSPGYIALMGFFAMSGYQISDSWARDPSWWRFSFRRMLRIFPPLFAVVAITVFIIGPMFTTWDLHEYRTHEQTWRYLLGTSFLFPLQHYLPGVFADNPYPSSVNGSLWTLPMEVVGYGIVLACGVVIALGVTRLILFPLFAFVFVVDGMGQATFGDGGGLGSFLSVPIGALASFMVPFILGMLLYNYRDRIPLRPVVAYALLAIWLITNATPAGRFVLPVMAAYGAFVLAHRWPKRLEINPRWYFGSYGMYIWAFPIQQMIVSAGVRNEWVLMAVAIPAAYLCGVLSWMYVEAPTQRLRRFLPKRRPAPPTPVPVPLRYPGIPAEGSRAGRRALARAASRRR